MKYYNSCRTLKGIGPIHIILLFLAASLSAQDVPRSYVAHHTTDTIRIDGMANENSWEQAEWSANFIDIEGQKSPRYRTRMKMLWDETNLYFFADLEEPHIWATLKQRDTVIFYNNDFEIFIDPDGDTHNYYEFEMNALNTVWDLLLTKPYRNHGRVIDSWDIKGLKSAVHIDGTLNSPDDTDKGWSVEIAMPWSVLMESSTSTIVPKNQFWRINFSRVNWDFETKNGRYSRRKDGNGKYLREYNWVWSPQGVINMHEPEHWGYVYFADDGVESEVAFEIPEDEKIKWWLYAQYRKLRGAGEGFDKVKNEILSKDRVVLGNRLMLEIEEHSSGWNISVMSPFSGKKLIINEDGQFISYEEKK